MNNRPVGSELFDAVRLFLQHELLPTLTDRRLRFQTLIAANLLSIAGREVAGEDEMLREEYQQLCALLHETPGSFSVTRDVRREVTRLNTRLCEQIRKGNFDAGDRREALGEVLLRQVLGKLQVANPQYLKAMQEEMATRKNVSWEK